MRGAHEDHIAPTHHIGEGVFIVQLGYHESGAELAREERVGADPSRGDDVVARRDERAHNVHPQEARSAYDERFHSAAIPISPCMYRAHSAAR